MGSTTRLMGLGSATSKIVFGGGRIVLQASAFVLNWRQFCEQAKDISAWLSSVRIGGTSFVVFVI